MVLGKRYRRARSAPYFRKRARFSGPSRRFFRRRGGNQITDKSNYAGSVIPYKSKRRMRPRAYRSMLYRTTQFKNHYRTINCVFDSIGAVVNSSTTADVHGFASINYGTDFWLPAGGAQPIDAGSGGGGASEAIVIRGGVCTLEVSSEKLEDNVKVKLWAVWTNANPDNTIIPGGTPHKIGWDPTVTPEFNQLGRLVFAKEFHLQGGGCWKQGFRVRPQKIDVNSHHKNGSMLVFYIVAYETTGNFLGVPAVVNVRSTYNMSFSFDQQ